MAFEGQAEVLDVCRELEKLVLHPGVVQSGITRRVSLGWYSLSKRFHKLAREIRGPFGVWQHDLSLIRITKPAVGAGFSRRPNGH